MQFKAINTQKLPFFVTLALATVLTSCGSFQYAGYDNDGIYGPDENEKDPKQTTVTTSTNDSNYYKNYFAENSAEVDAIKEENEVFTDIDSYGGNYTEQATDTLEQRPAYGGWGQNNSAVTINVIDNGWYGYNSPWMWDSGFGYGYNSWGRPWGWNNWGWNAGWGYGYGWNNAWCPPGYNNWGYNNGYYRNTNRYAYSNSRRGSSLYNNNLSRRSNSALTRRDYSTRRLSNSSSISRNTRSTRVRSSNNSSTRTIRNTRTTRPITRTTTRTTRPNASTRTTRPTTTRSTRSTRSTSTRSTPSRSTRSSSTRSSSSSSRSSGSSSSSSRRRRG